MEEKKVIYESESQKTETPMERAFRLAQEKKQKMEEKK